MNLENIIAHNQNLTACLAKIQELNELTDIAKSNIVYWSNKDDLQDNIGHNHANIVRYDSMIPIQENQIKEIIKQLGEEIK